MNTKSEEKVTIQNPDKATAVIANYYDVDEELKPTPVVTEIKKDPVKKGYNIKLSAGNVFYGYSLEDAISKVYGGNVKYYEWYKATGTLRKCINLTAALSTRAGFETTVSCIDKDDDPKKPEYQKIKETIDEVNRRVNLDHAMYITQVKRYIYGNAGWEIVPDTENTQILKLDPLKSSYMVPNVSDNGEFTGIDYYPSKSVRCIR
jgi:hypothetical protein